MDNPTTKSSVETGVKNADDGFKNHQRNVLQCQSCPEVFGPPVTGFVPHARVFLMGQAPGPKEMEAGKPFIWTAGRTLFRWIATTGVEESLFRERVYMGAVIRCFPGKLPGKSGDRKPSRVEIQQCDRFFQNELKLLQPDLVIAVGRMAIEKMMPFKLLDDVVGQVFQIEHEGHHFRCLPLPHPSGLSRWIQKPEGKAKVVKAMEQLAYEPSWRATFPEIFFS